ncbi:MAG TPA: 3-isopropylmalate dehydratase small subunit [Casimicrobiaceae bacterium]|nr:3-isopropylmalate dehydratase small subunit [Casimicrobiaceae bacterium]
MEPFNLLDAIALPMPRPNVDTDQIVPARYLQKPRSDDFGAYLFRDLRFRPDGSEIDEFVLNRSPYRGAKIVVAERNFGCGSSREQAVWSLHDYGFRAAIAPSFGDIFATNCTKNGLLPIVLPEPLVLRLLEALERQPGARIAIDLPSQVVVAPDGARHRFDVDPFVKQCLIEGLDEIAYTLTLLERITTFEARYANEPI